VDSGRLGIEYSGASYRKNGFLRSEQDRHRYIRSYTVLARYTMGGVAFYRTSFVLMESEQPLRLGLYCLASLGESIDVHFSSFRFSHPDFNVDLTSTRINCLLLKIDSAYLATATDTAPIFLNGLVALMDNLRLNHN